MPRTRCQPNENGGYQGESYGVRQTSPASSSGTDDLIHPCIGGPGPGVPATKQPEAPEDHREADLGQGDQKQHSGADENEARRQGENDPHVNLS